MSNKTVLFASMEELAAASSVKDGKREIDYEKASDTIEVSEQLCGETCFMVRAGRDTIAVVDESDLEIDEEFIYVERGTAIIADAMAIMPDGGVVTEWGDDHRVVPVERVIGRVIARIPNVG